MLILSILIAGLTACFIFFPFAELACPAYVEGINCTHREETQLLYTCESSSTDYNCSCTFENPLRSQLGWYKICKTKTALTFARKKVRKRQISDSNACGSIGPPKPGKVSCTVTPKEISCIGMCGEGFQFIDGSIEKKHSCHYSEGIWNPGSSLPLCKPTCHPPCENDGNCTNVNFCSCSNDYRGNACQYPISLCGISKNRLASNWQCNHTRTETTCDISCHAPNTFESQLNIERYECNIEGVWSRTLPPCVQVPQCEEPKVVEHGSWRLAIGHIFSAGSKVVYNCDDGYLLLGESQTTCNLSGIWSNEPPKCVKQPDIFCEDPGDISLGRRNISSRRFLTGASVLYECDDRFSMFGDSIITCQRNGQWSSNTPQCIPSETVPGHCPRPNPPKNSLVHIILPDQHPLRTILNFNIPISQRMFIINFKEGQGDEFSRLQDKMFLIGTRVQYKCKSRFYKLYGSEYQTCQPSKTWSGYQAACVPDCGKSDVPKTPFIVNGNSTRVGQWPWQVGLALKGIKGLQLLCGAVLISELWVLTAAHCVARNGSNVPIEPRRLLLFFGKYFRDFEKHDEHVQNRTVKRIIIHEDYDFVRYDADIALLQLDAEVILTTRVQPICLPSEDTTMQNIKDGKEGVVIGWGLTENGKFSDTLRETILPVVSHDRCEEAYREDLRKITITNNMFCAGHDSGFSDTCNGDSGGPFMFSVGPPNDNRWHLEGIVSWGSGSGCGKSRHYSGFTKVGKFVPWINMFV